MKVYISSTLRFFFGRKAEIDVQIPNPTVSSVLQKLTEEFPEAAGGLFDDGELRTFIRIFVSGEDWTDKSLHDREINKSAQVLILPLIACGSADESIISVTNESFITNKDGTAVLTATARDKKTTVQFTARFTHFFFDASLV